jgi:hypothetical protein
MSNVFIERVQCRELAFVSTSHNGAIRWLFLLELGQYISDEG